MLKFVVIALAMLGSAQAAAADASAAKAEIWPYDEIAKLKKDNEKLKADLEEIKKRVDVMVPEAGLSNVDGVPLLAMRRMLNEQGYLAAKDFNLVKGNPVVESKTVAAAVKFQEELAKDSSLDRKAIDGLIRNDQVVELACRGLGKNEPMSIYYLAWMFHAGQGVPLDMSKAVFLIDRAVTELNKKGPGYRTDLSNAIEFQNALAVYKAGTKPFTGAETAICPDLKSIRTRNYQEIGRPLEASEIKPSQPSARSTGFATTAPFSETSDDQATDETGD